MTSEIHGIGVDIVEVDRMEKALQGRASRRFMERVFTAREIEACESSAIRSQCYSARFAAKEAVVKAFGTGFSQGITPIMVEVKGGERNQPQIRLHAAALRFAEENGIREIHVSLTHTRNYACAFVTAVGRTK
jgi:holo-[acyl-carrier protein] synthase